MDSTDLIEMVRNKNQMAISRLYDQYAPPLYGLILRILKSPSKAEQILEQTFLKIIEEIGTYQKTTTFFTWMCCIARNLAVLQASQNVGNIIDQLDRDKINLSESQNFEKVSNLTEGMETKCKEVLNHLYFHGHSLNETSKVLNMPLDNTKIHLKLAFNHIHSKIILDKKSLSESF